MVKNLHFHKKKLTIVNISKNIDIFSDKKQLYRTILSINLTPSTRAARATRVFSLKNMTGLKSLKLQNSKYSTSADFDNSGSRWPSGLWKAR